MDSIDAVYKQALALAVRPDDHFLELAECLAKLKKHDPTLLKQFAEKSRMGSRKVYYLIDISHRFDSLRLPKARLKSIGWTKLQVIGKHIDESNAERWLKLAEENTTRELQALVRGEKPEANVHCVLMYFTPEQYRQFEEAVLDHGGTRSGRGLINKEEAIIRIIKHAHQATRENEGHDNLRRRSQSQQTKSSRP